MGEEEKPNKYNVTEAIRLHDGAHLKYMHGSKSRGYDHLLTLYMCIYLIGVVIKEILCGMNMFPNKEIR